MTSDLWYNSISGQIMNDLRAGTVGSCAVLVGVGEMTTVLCLCLYRRRREAKVQIHIVTYI